MSRKTNIYVDMDVFNNHRNFMTEWRGAIGEWKKIIERRLDKLEPAPEPKYVKSSWLKDHMEAFEQYMRFVNHPKTAPEPKCPIYKYDCPICHPGMAKFYKDFETYKKLIKDPVPLRAQVAKALGKTVIKIPDEWKPHDLWRMEWDHNPGQFGQEIPPYDTDIKLRDDMVHQYLNIANKNRKPGETDYSLSTKRYPDNSGHVSLSNITRIICVSFGEHSGHYRANKMLWAKTELEAICLAIVKHAEAK